MKLLRKINKGLILTIIVVAAVAIYSINVELNRNKEKGNIKLACEEFLKTTSESLILPEKYHNLDTKVSEEDLNNIMEEVKKDLKEKMIDNDSAIEIQSTIIESELNEQIYSENIITKIEREITKISSYTFDGDQVTVKFKSKVNKDINYLNEINKVETKNSSFNAESDTIILQKVDNTWKVVYSDIQFSEGYYPDLNGFQVIYN